MDNDQADGLFLNARQARQVDRLAIEQLGIHGIVLMENAARGCAEWLMATIRPRRVAIVCGPGNNGGDGFGIARHLSNVQVDVAIYLATPPERYAGDARTNLEICQHLGLNWCVIQDQVERTAGQMLTNALHRFEPDVVVDALLGTGSQGSPRGEIAGIIEAINRSGIQIVAVDVPSGWDTTDGQPGTPCICARHTLTMAAPKIGFDRPEFKRFVGDWQVIEIGIPGWFVEQAAAT
ncbi:MAG TPA: NAD(P)H-hydrate epimerase [Pirellulaceae bacterium]|nr:NAD(P)H-hydrate epimerase [Pirellulaceae bacterium]